MCQSNYDHNRLTSSLTLCTINVRSVKNKIADFTDYVCSCKADLFALTETWLANDDTALKKEITPNGYSLISQFRVNRIGGGTALLSKSTLNVKQVTAAEIF